jgi:hypothetical protein
MIIPNFHPFEGQHCETVAFGNLLKHQGLELSEPMLFGIGAGLGFIYWKMKTMPLPFLGGRTKTLARNICANLKIQIEEKETTSQTKAWQNIAEHLDSGTPVALQLDCFHLDYFTKKIHFAGHHVAMYGYDATHAYLVDTLPQGSMVKTTLENLAKARSEKGPMSAKNKSVTVSFNPADLDIKSAILQAIRANAKEFLNPPIKNLGYKGIHKTSAEIKKWYAESTNIKSDFSHAAMMMEKAGTGGALFRNLYRDFLKEANQLLQLDFLEKAHEHFQIIATKWTEVSTSFSKVAETQSLRWPRISGQWITKLSYGGGALSFVSLSWFVCQG